MRRVARLLAVAGDDERHVADDGVDRSQEDEHLDFRLQPRGVRFQNSFGLDADEAEQNSSRRAEISAIENQFKGFLGA